MKVAVVGGGIIGLGSAYCLIQRFPTFEFTLISESFSPNTTSDVAAGLWCPYLLAETPPELIQKWSLETLDFFKKVWTNGDGGLLGLTLIPIFLVGSTTSNSLSPPTGALGLHQLSQEELSRLRIPEAKQGFSFTTFVCESTKILPYFLGEFKRYNGAVVERRVHDLNELCKDFDVVIHCTGLGALELTADQDLRPIRGQVRRVKAPHVFHSIQHTGTGGYVIPNQDSLVIGGTHQENDWNLKISLEDKESIVARCTQMIPSIKNSVVINDFVGLRPGRRAVRVEREKVEQNARVSWIIHNYGHGGAGVTLFWGCALQVAKIFEELIQETSFSKF